MNNWMRHLLLVFVLLLFGLSGCAKPRSQFVLLPSPDGHVGNVTIASKTGEARLSKAFESTDLARTEDKPSKPVVMTEEQVNILFKDALSAQPNVPVTYLLYFELSSTRLTKESEKLLPQALNYIRNNAFSDISISGHSDRIGSRDINIKLSKDRANAVAKLLINMGVPPESLKVESHGTELPLIDKPEGVPEPRNRRVELVVR